MNAKFARCYLIPLALLLSVLSVQAEVPESTRERAAQLRAAIAHADELYFKQAAPELSDTAYDDLKRELAELERRFPDVRISTAASVADDRTGRFPVVRHRERMLSLHKSYTRAELEAFESQVADALGATQTEFVIEPKFDGIAISVVYEKGSLLRAVTRGNGDEGEDVTANARAIDSLSRELQRMPASPVLRVPEWVELRGEIYVARSEFERINREQAELEEPLFANPRALAAGTMQQSDPAVVAQRGLKIVFYGIGACIPESARPSSQMLLHGAIKAWGLPGVAEIKEACTPDEVWTAVQRIGHERATYPFPTDGAVVKVKEVAQQRRLGVSADAPNWAMAYKFRAPRASTRLRAITIQIGRTGVLTPVAELEPVQLDGIRVTRASLHNRDAIERDNLRVGDVVIVEKAGEVIPSIAGVDRSKIRERGTPYVFPDKCPACHQPVAGDASESVVRCTNAQCPAQLRARLIYFAGRSGVRIRGLGEAAVERLIEKGTLRSVADIYQLTPAQLESAGVRSSDRVLKAIAESRNAETWRVIAGLSIPHVGPSGARALAAHVRDLKSLSSATQETFIENDHSRIPGLSTAGAESLAAYLADVENRKIVESLAREFGSGNERVR